MEEKSARHKELEELISTSLETIHNSVNELCEMGHDYQLISLIFNYSGVPNNIEASTGVIGTPRKIAEAFTSTNIDFYNSLSSCIAEIVVKKQLSAFASMMEPVQGNA